jgi:hypothetical protein
MGCSFSVICPNAETDCVWESGFGEERKSS